MVCTTSQHVKLYRFLYKEATGNYGDLPAIVSTGWTDMKVTNGPSELAIEQQEITLPNHGEQLRNDHTQFAYRKVTGGNVTTPHHASFATNHQGLLGSGFGSYTAATGTGTLSVEATDTNTITLQSGEGSGFSIGQMIKIGTDRIATITGISTDTLSISYDIPATVTYPVSTAIAGVDYWNPQCLQDNKYYHALVWDAGEYWAVDFFKPSFTMTSNDGGVPKQWTMNLTAYAARRLTGTDATTAATAFSTTAIESYTIATLNNKVNLHVQSIPVQDVSSVTLEIERDNTRWESDVNAYGAVGSINDITSITGMISVFANKDTYHGYTENNTEVAIGWQSADANFAFYAPASKFTRSGENPIADENNQNIAVLGISYNEEQDETLQVYLGDL